MRQPSASEYAFFDIPGPLAIAHRGGNAAGAEKENTMAAFESASQAGIIYAETDTVATCDGVALALHGAKNENQATKTGLPLRSRIGALTFAEVQATIRVGGEPIPRLEEVLHTFDDMRFFIDPKTPDSVGPLARVVRQNGNLDRVSIGGFCYKDTKAVVEQVPGGSHHVPTCVAKLGSAALIGLGSTKTEALAKAYLRRSDATSFQVPHNIVTPTMVEQAQELGMKVIVWPLRPAKDDNRTYMDRALEQGVDGLMSDHTLELKATVLAHDPNNASIRK